MERHEEMRKTRKGRLSVEETEIVGTKSTQTERLPFLQGQTWQHERYRCVVAI